MIYTPLEETLNTFWRTSSCVDWYYFHTAPVILHHNLQYKPHKTSHTSTYYTWHNEKQQCWLLWQCHNSSSSSKWCHLTLHAFYISHVITAATLADTETQLCTVSLSWHQPSLESCWPNARDFTEVILLYRDTNGSRRALTWFVFYLHSF